MSLPWICPACGKGFQTEVGLRKHAALEHSSRYHRGRALSPVTGTALDALQESLRNQQRSGRRRVSSAGRNDDRPARTVSPQPSTSAESAQPASTTVARPIVPDDLNLFSSSSDEDWNVVKHNLPSLLSAVSVPHPPASKFRRLTAVPPSAPPPKIVAIGQQTEAPVTVAVGQQTEAPRTVATGQQTKPPVTVIREQQTQQPETATGEQQTEEPQTDDQGTQVIPHFSVAGIVPPPYGVTIQEIVTAVRANQEASAGEILAVLVNRHGNFPRGVRLTLTAFILTAIAAERNLAQTFIGRIRESESTPQAMRSTFQSLHDQLYAVAARHVDSDATEAAEPWPCLDEAELWPEVIDIESASDVDAAEEENANPNHGTNDDPM